MLTVILGLLGGIGATELLVIAGVVILMFGGKKIPEMFRGIGKGLREFKDAQNETEVPMENEAQIPAK